MMCHVYPLSLSLSLCIFTWEQWHIKTTPPTLGCFELFLLRRRIGRSGDDVGVEGFPTIKFGDPANLEAPPMALRLLRLAFALLARHWLPAR